MDPRVRVMFRIVIRCIVVVVASGVVGVVGTRLHSVVLSALGGVAALAAVITGISTVVVTAVAIHRDPLATWITTVPPRAPKFDQFAWTAALATGGTLALVLWALSPLNGSALICAVIGAVAGSITQRVISSRRRPSDPP